jgi:hypothetical protein
MIFLLNASLSHHKGFLFQKIWFICCCILVQRLIININVYFLLIPTYNNKDNFQLLQYDLFLHLNKNFCYHKTLFHEVKYLYLAMKMIHFIEVHH